MAYKNKNIKKQNLRKQETLSKNPQSNITTNTSHQWDGVA